MDSGIGATVWADAPGATEFREDLRQSLENAQLSKMSLALSIFAGCREVDTRPDAVPLEPAASSPRPRLEVVAGDLQIGEPGRELPNPLVVRVTDAFGRPLPGLVVNFRVTAGGGSVFAGAAAATADGRVADRWTLGPASADTQRVEVRAVDPLTGAPLVFATFRAITSSAGTPSTGLVAHYSLDGHANDVSGGGLHGTIIGATTVADRSGRANGAYRFTGSSRISLPSAVLYDAPQGTVSIWMRAETFGTGGIAVTKTSSVNHYQLDLIGGNLVRFYLQNTDLRSTTPLTVDRWHMVTTTWDGMEKRIYVDGRLDASAPSTHAVPALDLGVTMGNFGSGSPLNGSIDDVRVYRRALSAADVARLYAETAPAAPDLALIAHYPFDGDAGDVSGNALHGTIAGASLVADRTGQSNGAYRFTGTGRIALPPAALYDMPRGTVSVWMRAEVFGTGGVVLTKSQVGVSNYYQLDLIGGNLVRFYLENTDLRSVTPLAVNRWYMVTTTWDGAVKRIYIDGRRDAAAASANRVPALDLSVWVGSLGGSSPLNGSVDDVRVYRRALSDTEVAQLYAATAPLLQ